jgi:hypothetical protein
VYGMRIEVGGDRCWWHVTDGLWVASAFYCVRQQDGALERPFAGSADWEGSIRINAKDTERLHKSAYI